VITQRYVHIAGAKIRRSIIDHNHNSARFVRYQQNSSTEMNSAQSKPTFCPSNPLELMSLLSLCNPDYVPQSLAIALSSPKGIRGKFVIELGQVIPDSILSKLLEIQSEQLPEIADETLTAFQSDAVLGVCKIWSLLMQQFNHRRDLAASWISKPKRPFGGQTPISLIRGGYGREAVFDVLERMKTGDFS